MWRPACYQHHDGFQLHHHLWHFHLLLHLHPPPSFPGRQLPLFCHIRGDVPYRAERLRCSQGCLHWDREVKTAQQHKELSRCRLVASAKGLYQLVRFITQHMHGFRMFLFFCKIVTGVHICTTCFTNGLHVIVYSLFICSCNLLVSIASSDTNWLTVNNVCKNYLRQNWQKYLNGC